MVLETIHQRKLDKAYQDACKEDTEAEKKLFKATEAKDGYRGTDENPLVIKSLKKATAAKTRTGENVESTIQAIFLQYFTHLSEEASRPWFKIVKEQIDTAPFTDIYGAQHQVKRPRSWNSFMECVQLHLQSVFRYDAVEMLRFYISNGLKKPNRAPRRDFVWRVDCLNRYLTLLLCLHYSSKAAKSMKVVGPFDDPDLASHILRMVPMNWQDQYVLTGATVPQSIRELLEALERIEQAFPTNKVGDGPKTTSMSSDSSKWKMVSFNERIPKKRRREKHCLLCKKRGGARTTHNTPDCRKSDSNDTPKKNFNGKKSNGTSHGPEKPA
jgi:hypothetical protein